MIIRSGNVVNELFTLIVAVRKGTNSKKKIYLLRGAKSTGNFQRGLMATPHLPKTQTREAGFSLLELIVAIVFLLMISAAMAALSRFITFAMSQGEAKTVVVNTARNGLDAVTLKTRNDLV